MTVAELLSDESKWIKGKYAVDQHGHTAISTAPEACAWCLEGAFFRCYSSNNPLCLVQLKNLVRIVVEESGFTTIPAFNDAPITTFADIRRVIEKAGV